MHVLFVDKLVLVTWWPREPKAALPNTLAGCVLWLWGEQDTPGRRRGVGRRVEVRSGDCIGMMAGRLGSARSSEQPVCRLVPSRDYFLIHFSVLRTYWAHRVRTDTHAAEPACHVIAWTVGGARARTRWRCIRACICFAGIYGLRSTRPCLFRHDLFTL